jgi:hypothetical protein
MTTHPAPAPRAATIVITGGGAKPTDEHLLSIVHCVDEEIIDFLKRREKRNLKRRHIVKDLYNGRHTRDY